MDKMEDHVVNKMIQRIDSAKSSELFYHASQFLDEAPDFGEIYGEVGKNEIEIDREEESERIDFGDQPKEPFNDK